MSLHQQQQLWNASRAGDHPAVQRALDQGADVQAVFGEKSSTPLHEACYCGYLKIIRTLLAAGAKTEAKAQRGQTPLIWACFAGHVEVIRILVLEAGANVKAQDRSWADGASCRCTQRSFTCCQILTGGWRCG